MIESGRAECHAAKARFGSNRARRGPANRAAAELAGERGITFVDAPVIGTKSRPRR